MVLNHGFSRGFDCAIQKWLQLWLWLCNKIVASVVAFNIFFSTNLYKGPFIKPISIKPIIKKLTIQISQNYSYMDTTTPVSVFMIVLLVSFALYYCFMFLSCCILKFQTSTFNNNYDLCKLVSCLSCLFILASHLLIRFLK